MWKLYAGAGVIIGAIIILYGSVRYDAGYDAAIAESAKIQRDALLQQAKDLRASYEQSIADLRADTNDSKQRQADNNETVKETVEVIKYVDREIKVPATCDDLVNNVISVRQQATGIINRARSKTSADSQ